MPASCWGCDDWIVHGGTTVTLPGSGETVGMHEQCARSARRIFWHFAGALDLGPQPQDPLTGKTHGGDP